AVLGVSVGAALPGIYVPLEQDGAPPMAGDFVGSFSGRGGQFGKPDVLAPGWAFSTVPSFDTGNEIKAGTSMSAPYVAGLAACLMSAGAGGAYTGRRRGECRPPGRRRWPARRARARSGGPRDRDPADLFRPRARSARRVRGNGDRVESERCPRRPVVPARQCRDRPVHPLGQPVV